MKDWLLLLCVGIVAVFAYHERNLWLPQKAVPATSPAEGPPSVQKSIPTLAPQPLPAETPLAPTSPKKAELTALVFQSQRLAVARYPSLGEAASEMNIRFNSRYKRLLAEDSPRLQDPDWPVQLADECAKDAGVHPVVARPAPSPALPAVASQTASPPVAPVPSAGAAASASRGSPPTPAAAQTLIFHPAAARSPLTSPAAGFPAVAATTPANALPFITMDAVNQSSGNNYTYNWGSYYGWYDISYRQSVGIAINLRNMSRTPAAVNLRWIFFARNPHSSERFIFAAAGKALDLPPGESTSVAAASPLIQSREISSYGWIGERYMYGSKYEGWLVQLLERGSNRLIKQTGSTSYLEDLAKRDDFSAVVEAYRAKRSTQGNAAGL